MKKCPKCNTELDDGTAFCTYCGADLRASGNPPQNSPSGAQYGAPQPTQPQYSQQQYSQQQYSQQPQYGQFVPAAPADNRKTYSVMSYISILWLFGMFSAPEKYDPRVRFNVGQGIIASIFNAGLSLIGALMTWGLKVIFTKEVTETLLYQTVTVTKTSAAFGILTFLLWFLIGGIAIFFMVYGIIKVCQNKDSYLPVIGRWSFYR